jgi:hypothetical protein
MKFEKSTETRERDERRSAMSQLRQVDLTLDRRKEKQLLYGWLDTFALKQNQICLIEGQSGSGKAQFLTKATRRSRNRNVLLISQDARQAAGPFGLIRAWVEAVCDADLPASVAQALSAFVNTRSVLAVLAGHTSDQPTSAGWQLPSTDEGDDLRKQLVTELVRFFRIVCDQRPLLLAVSNYDALDTETQTLILRIVSGLKSCPAGLILTVEEGSLVASSLSPHFELTQLRIPALTTVQVQGLLLQVCKRHRLQHTFVETIREQTKGNAARILLTLWYLIDNSQLIFTKAGWAAPSRIQWKAIPADLHLEVATRIVGLSQDAGLLLKGLATGVSLLSLPRLLGMLKWDRKRFGVVSTQINAIYPVFQTSELSLEPAISSKTLLAIRDHCTSDTERATWSSRIADTMADTGSASHHEELALLYEAIGKTEAALTYRIAAAHKAKTVTCFWECC